MGPVLPVPAVRAVAAPPRVVIDRTTALCGADYEWPVHVSAFAVKAGVTGPQLRSLGRGKPEDLCWDDPADRAVLRAVDELHATSDLTDEGWDGLVSAVGEDGVLDLLLLCGWYHAISFTVRALRLPIEPGTGPVPALKDDCQGQLPPARGAGQRVSLC